MERAHGIDLLIPFGRRYSHLDNTRQWEGLSGMDMVVLSGIFMLYIWFVAEPPTEGPHSGCLARGSGALSATPRGLAGVALGVVGALVILLEAKPFARAIVETGMRFEIDEFSLLQWLAPIRWSAFSLGQARHLQPWPLWHHPRSINGSLPVAMLPLTQHRQRPSGLFALAVEAEAGATIPHDDLVHLRCSSFPVDASLLGGTVASAVPLAFQVASGLRPCPFRWCVCVWL